MKFITFLKKQMALAFGVGVLLSFNSCGSFQYSGIYDDGIYSESVPAQQANETVDNSSNSSDYYKNYFKEKSLQIEEDNSVFTDVDSYGGTYADDSEHTNNYAGWGENNSSEIIVNVYDNGPYYGNGWGFGYQINWGWNFGWNNWGFGFGNQTIIIHGTVHGTTHGTILTVSTAVIIIMAILIMDTMVTEDVLTPTLTAEDRDLDMEIQEV